MQHIISICKILICILFITFICLFVVVFESRNLIYHYWLVIVFFTTIILVYLTEYLEKSTKGLDK